jgi:hypothetical protein
MVAAAELVVPPRKETPYQYAKPLTVNAEAAAPTAILPVVAKPEFPLAPEGVTQRTWQPILVGIAKVTAPAVLSAWDYF